MSVTSEDFRTGQGTIIPTIFIGLGGTGSRIVDRIAKRASRLPNWDTQMRDLTTFVSIDTNELDQHKLKNIPEGNRLNIASFDKSRAISHFRRSDDAQALQWLDKGYQPRPGFKPGAGQIRLESRLGFFYHSPEIRQRLQELVSNTLRPGITWRQSSPPKYNVYVFCTLAGGTGSGSYLSLAYLIDEIISEQNWQPRLIGNCLLSTLLVDKVGPELHPNIHANTYAALKELEHLTKLDYSQVKRQGRTSEDFVFRRDENKSDVMQVKTRPFFLTFIFDKPAFISLTDVEASIADAAYLQTFTPVIELLAGELDNYEQHLEKLTSFPGELKNVGLGYTKNYGAFGAAGLVLPGEDLLEYCSLRFAAQAIRSQITFGVDPTAKDDDRARALAKLAVDYEDPKFLNTSNAGREKMINDAFVASVQEMARQDANQGLTDGFWYSLMESIDLGLTTGSDKNGEPIRGESNIQRVERKLTESRNDLLNKVSIKDRAFVFQPEGINQYVELVSRLLDDIRSARQIMDEGARGLTNSASEGEVIEELKLDPIAERYLVVRLMERCENEWIPDAEQQLEKARKNDVGTPAVRERLERELYESLQEASTNRPLLNRDQPFLDARDEAQDYYKRVAAGARKTFDGDVRLRQLRALLEYLKRRSSQYASLATRMDVLVQDLERDAERLRRGESSIVPGLSLRVEVFQTLDEPRQRIWDEVYQALFIQGGRYISTFDRQVLATTITDELKPVVRADGSIVAKSVDATVNDLRRALNQLGRDRLKPTIFGEANNRGLDIVQGIELEAKIVLGPNKQPGEEVTSDEIDAYREKKFRALNQLAGVMARVQVEESKALDDGVVFNRTRLLIVDQGIESEDFMRGLTDILQTGGRQVKKDKNWYDPRLIIVHDVILPVPLYYFEPVTSEVEDAYRQLAADERRAHQLHTDFNWEKSLPNLNPRNSELTVGWSLEVLAEGLVSKVISRDQGAWVWHVGGTDNQQVLGHNLSNALYRIGEIHRIENLQKLLQSKIETAKTAMGSDAEHERREKLVGQFNSLFEQIHLRELNGDMTREDILDRAIIRALIQEIPQARQVGEQVDRNAEVPASKDSLYDNLEF